MEAALLPSLPLDCLLSYFLSTYPLGTLYQTLDMRSQVLVVCSGDRGRWNSVRLSFMWGSSFRWMCTSNVFLACWTFCPGRLPLAQGLNGLSFLQRRVCPCFLTSLLRCGPEGTLSAWCGILQAGRGSLRVPCCVCLESQAASQGQKIAVLSFPCFSFCHRWLLSSRQSDTLASCTFSFVCWSVRDLPWLRRWRKDWPGLYHSHPFSHTRTSVLLLVAFLHFADPVLFYKLMVRGHPASSTSVVGAVFPTASVHFVSRSHFGSVQSGYLTGLYVMLCSPQAELICVIRDLCC